jgi:predicted molibdopterin-dependent oxidoreductase YjgC
LPARVPVEAVPKESRDEPAPAKAGKGELQLLRFRPLFSGPAVERVDELQFQRPAPEVELSARDALRLDVKRGDPLLIHSNGTSVELRAAVNKRLKTGVVRIAEEHARDLHPIVEVNKQ